MRAHESGAETRWGGILTVAVATIAEGWPEVVEVRLELLRTSNPCLARTNFVVVRFSTVAQHVALCQKVTETVARQTQLSDELRSL